MNKFYMKETIKPLHQLMYINFFFVGAVSVLASMIWIEKLFLIPLALGVVGFIYTFKAVNKRLIKIIKDHESK